MAILGNLQIEDAPVREATTLEIPAAQIGDVQTTEVQSDPANAYFLNIPLTYNVNGEDRTFNAKVYLRSEWFDPGFKAKVHAGEIETKATQAYRIGMAKLRELFTAVGITTGSFDTTALIGRYVGFRAVPDNKKPQYRVVQRFFTAKN